MTRGAAASGSASPGPADTLDLMSTAHAAGSDREQALVRLLNQRIVIIDGAMGTMIQAQRLAEADYRGLRFKDNPRDLKGNNDLLALTQPALIESFHRQYLGAGADIVETNTFNSNAVSMADYGMESLVSEINLTAARLA